ncbi:Pyridine nucleotide-disulphide oxidoreductase [Halovenus aranensis]|uniref:Pyridine nucleotide-disulphide oxidoreductase n=1 Tax=Halovenus aranensis TaxID=890420 RepID=A0A1G8YR33_9EURY|nr:NAD(P)/FAD-dependent oxidoreductase [Halovenus aranensis]SDK04490.1 Pyridine nucleotide-disulphide oxidoreductase [Halovenus aranensis]
MPDTETELAETDDHDVVIVGGGPAGCSAGVFCAREGFDTVIFDRGRSSLQRCAHLENYLGFPGGVDIETMYGLMHDHAETAGCEIVSDLVESVEQTDDEESFRVTPQEGESITARQVVAATRYDGEYMRGLDDDAEMFETHEHGGKEHEHFDGEYADHDGTTPVDRLYVVTPAEEDDQAIVAAGRGARVARRVIADARIDDGWWEEVADGVDWMRRRAELDDELSDRTQLVEWFDAHYGADAPVAPDSDRYQRVREARIGKSVSSHISPDEIDARAGAGQEALASHLDPAHIVEAVDTAALLDQIDDDKILAAAEDRRPERESGVER